jgi:hypothetical protein
MKKISFYVVGVLVVLMLLFLSVVLMSKNNWVATGSLLITEAIVIAVICSFEPD